MLTKIKELLASYIGKLWTKLTGMFGGSSNDIDKLVAKIDTVDAKYTAAIDKITAKLEAGHDKINIQINNVIGKTEAAVAASQAKRDKQIAQYERMKALLEASIVDADNTHASNTVQANAKLLDLAAVKAQYNYN